jgi:phage gpG-like protein
MGVIETLDNLANSLKTPSKLGTIGGMAVEMIRGKIHSGQGFAPLSPATAAYRGAGRPLQDTSGLRYSITFKVVDDTVTVGTNKPYAAIQHNGGVINAKKNWLWIPAAGTRQLQRRYGYGPTDVLNGLKTAGYSIFRKGRTMCYREKKKRRNEGGQLQNVDHVLYYLKKSVEIPARPFFYLSDKEMDLLMREAGSALEQL